MLVLGIETSCDETAAAVVRNRSGEGMPPRGEILSNQVYSQVDEHRIYGGVVPEIAARAHVDKLDVLVREAMTVANLRFDELDGVAATAGPGLIGGLLVGLMTGKAIAAATGVPFIAVNHLEGHALTPRLTDGLAFPYLLLLVSGGHTQLVSVDGLGIYRRLGSTIDDALGEAFDKTAKMLGLPYPGGPEVEALAKGGDPERFSLPRPLLGRPGLDFSFAGLKNAVRLAISRLDGLSEQDKADICAGFQAAVSDCIENRTVQAIERFRSETGLDNPTLVVAGGVAANQSIRTMLNRVCENAGAELCAPPLTLCTDNAAMIAWAGAERLAAGQHSSLGVPPRARWPLDETATPMVGYGRLGAKV